MNIQCKIGSQSEMQQQGFSLFVFISSVIYISTTEAFDWEFFRFKCPSDCSVLPCTKMKILRTRCRGGTVYDICGCCQRCAKLEREACGGYRDAVGTCDVGLHCHVKKKRRFGLGKCKSK